MGCHPPAFPQPSGTSRVLGLWSGSTGALCSVLDPRLLPTVAGGVTPIPGSHSTHLWRVSRTSHGPWTVGISLGGSERSVLCLAPLCTPRLLRPADHGVLPWASGEGTLPTPSSYPDTWKGVTQPAASISHILMLSIKNMVKKEKKPTLPTADCMRWNRREQGGAGQRGRRGQAWGPLVSLKAANSGSTSSVFRVHIPRLPGFLLPEEEPKSSFSLRQHDSRVKRAL